ncbi:hypothetical protein QN002_005112 [Salmonella enterica subsp. enterica serovar Muenchen]|nr:hypothetical protein [Salmonella enterica subsp. enterica serovar Muenchen]
MQKVQFRPVEKAPANNVVRRLHWLRKRDALTNNPGATFPLTIYVTETRS